MSTRRPTGARRLRAALWTWSARDRRASGDVVLDTARDLIDAGGPASREALSVARTGLVLRGRGLVRGTRLAPWQEAAPLVLVASAVLLVGLTVADAGGWSGLWAQSGQGADATPDGLYWAVREWLHAYGALVAAALAAVLVPVALVGRRWASVLLMLGVGLALTAWIRNGPHLGYVGAALSSAPTPSARTQTAITLFGVVGLIVGAALLTALAWAVTGSFASRHGRAAAGPGLDARAGRPPRRGVATVVAVAYVAAVAIPLLAPALTTGMESALGTTNTSFSEYAGPAVDALWLLIISIPVVLTGTLLLPDRAPALAVACGVLTVALWIPGIWMAGGYVFVPVRFWPGLGEEAAVLGYWAFYSALGLVVFLWAAARAGRAATRRAGGSDGGPGFSMARTSRGLDA